MDIENIEPIDEETHSSIDSQEEIFLMSNIGKTFLTECNKNILLIGDGHHIRGIFHKSFTDKLRNSQTTKAESCYYRDTCSLSLSHKSFKC